MVDASTQLRSYYETVAEGLPARRREIMRFLLDSQDPVTRAEITLGTTCTLQSVCGRVNELLEMGLIIVVGEVHDELTDRFVESLGIPDREVEPKVAAKKFAHIQLKRVEAELAEMKKYAKFLWHHRDKTRPVMKLAEWRDYH